MSYINNIRKGNIKTVKQAKEALGLYGMSIKRELGEYVVNFKGARSDSAYYTNDLFDACNTSLSMCAESLGLVIHETRTLIPVN